MQKKTWIGIVAALGVAIAIIIWFNNQGHSHKPNNSIRIGIVLSLTGDVAAYGERSLKGVNLAVEEVNSSGGINGIPISTIVEDAKSSPKDGVAAIQKLINVDHIKIIVGDVLSSTTLTMSPIAEQNKVILFAPGASNPNLRNAGDYIFRNWSSDDFDGKSMAEYAFLKADVKTIAILVQRTDYCLGLSEAFEKELTRLGGRISLKETFETDAVDFRSQLTKIGNLGEKVVYLSAESRQTGTVLRQSRELGLIFKWFSSLTVDTPECANIAGTAREGVIFSTPSFDIASTKPEVQQFVKGFRAKYNSDPEVTAGHAYDAINILAQVMRNSGTDTEAVKKGLYATQNFPGITGITTFDDHGDVVKNVFIKRILNNSPHFLEEFSFAKK